MDNMIAFRRIELSQKTIRAELILPQGAKRRRWVVVEHMPDGKSSVHNCRGRQRALSLANILQRVQEKRQREFDGMMLHSLGKFLLSMPVEELETVKRLAEGTLSLLTGLGYYQPVNPD